MPKLIKAGGGTIDDRMDKLNFIFKYHQDHKTPKPEFYNKYESLIISLRDPIDRMKSAWYWRMLLQCRYDQKDEIRQSRSKDCNIFINPDKCCRNKGDEERTPEYWNRYNGHAYNLAEAFCSDDTTIQKQAYKDIQLVPHVGHTIVDWLGLFNSSSSNNNNNNTMIVYNNNNNNNNNHDDAIQIIQTKIIAVILEKGYNFNEQIDGAIEWLLNITYNGDEEKASLVFNKAKQEQEEYEYDAAYAAKNQIIKKEENNNTNNNTNHTNNTIAVKKIVVNRSHSSKAVTFPWLKEVTSITTYGSCCLVRHYYKYKNDYLLLLNPKFPNWLCNKGTTKTKQLCYNAISSIIERKRSMVEYALYSNRSCSDIDSVINVVYVVDNDNDNGNGNGNGNEINNENDNDNGNGNGNNNGNNNNIRISYNTKGGGGGEKEIVQQLPSAVKMTMMSLFGLLMIWIIYYYKRRHKFTRREGNRHEKSKEAEE
jgi:hypothetical protein